jgi:hypothetical protein
MSLVSQVYYCPVKTGLAARAAASDAQAATPEVRRRRKTSDPVGDGKDQALVRSSSTPGQDSRRRRSQTPHRPLIGVRHGGIVKVVSPGWVGRWVRAEDLRGLIQNAAVSATLANWPAGLV